MDMNQIWLTLFIVGICFIIYGVGEAIFKRLFKR